MITKLVIRRSAFNDYLAVDEVSEDEKILNTRFYLSRNKPIIVKYKDQEEQKWIKTELIFDGFKINAKDIDENSDYFCMTYEIDKAELLDKNQIKPIA